MAQLKVDRHEAGGVIARHFDEGEALRREAVADNKVVILEEEVYREWWKSQKRWNQRTKAALGYVYEDKEAANEFDRAADPPSFVGGYSQWPQAFESDYEDVGNGLNVLTSLIERLQYDEPPAREPQPRATAPASSGASGESVVFLVHGHDHGTRETVARFLEKAGSAQIVILDEQADEGQTLLEKLEKHASDSKYAVVLLTGDDVGGVKGETHQSPRARQNVVCELGWFCGQLGRKNVAVLCAADVERPSDLAGLVYLGLDQDWQRKLVRNLNAAGFDHSLAGL